MVEWIPSSSVRPTSSADGHVPIATREISIVVRECWPALLDFERLGLMGHGSAPYGVVEVAGGQWRLDLQPLLCAIKGPRRSNRDGHNPRAIPVIRRSRTTPADGKGALAISARPSASRTSCRTRGSGNPGA